VVSLPVKVRIEVIDILGTGECSMGQKIGEVYNYPEDRGKMCPSSFYSLIPWIMVMQSGGIYLGIMCFFRYGGAFAI
jgi:uncharacterized repeat protein (TIGR04076 family)